jgi:hypothetical protein
MAERVQLRRSKGWRKPDGVIVVARPSRFGNPFTFEAALAAGAADKREARARCVAAYRAWMHGEALPAGFEQPDEDRRAWILEHLDELAGHDLACWCPLDQDCHADVLLDLANR